MTVVERPRALADQIRPEPSFGKRVGHYVRRHPGGVLGSMLVLLILLVAIFANQIAGQDPTALNPAERLAGPSAAHRFGTDNFGRDLFSRTVHGTRISLGVGFGVSLAALLGGIIFGLLAGYYRRLDAPLMRLMDAVMAFPGIILAIGIVAATGQSIANVILALGVVYIPRVARLVRSVVLSVREQAFIEAARAIGVRDWRLLGRHILPSSWSPIIVQGTFVFAEGVLGEATLSFLGVGPPPIYPSWGTILSEARPFIREAPWMMILPGIALTVTVLSLNLMGDGLRDLLDPRLRRRA